MYFALGLFVAGLVSLLLLPAISRRAMRLSRRRIEALLPLSMDEVTAERDLLRAEFAAERRRLEQKMEAQAADHAKDLAELGRRATELVALNDRLTKLGADHAELNADHAAAVRELAEANAERSALVMEIHDATGLHQTLRERYDSLAADHRDLTDLAEDRRAAVAGLETKNEGLLSRIEALERDLDAWKRKAGNEEDRASGLGEERDMVLKEMRAVEQLMASTQARFESERDRASALQASLDGQRRSVDETLIAHREMQRSLDAAERAREASMKQASDAAARLAEHARGAREAERIAADQIEDLKAEVAALKGALEAARATQPAPRGDDNGLREAVAEIGARIARMAETDARS
ncbi:MAG: hypothetical protein KGM42_14920 [Hyphomicrobiales bacterium]|nr:hypothetical protein [Hyphomicrobiales bacterium]